LNVIFHDYFADHFQARGATMCREELDAQNGVSEVTFRDQVHEAYNDKETDQYEVVFDSPKFLGINPKLFVKHSVTKLEIMWKTLNKLYSDARQSIKNQGIIILILLLMTLKILLIMPLFFIFVSIIRASTIW
jgi:hypothetical protein